MKKILSLLLIMILVFSMGIVAFAETDPAGNPVGDQDDVDWTNVKFKKSITTVENDGALHPAETFKFTVTGVSAEDEQGKDITPIPVIAGFNITVDEGNGEAIATVNLPTYTNIGTYVYEVVETASNTAGMVYDTAKYEFTVVVLNDGIGGFKRLIVMKDAETKKKTDVFDNKYNAGSLVVNKEITGNNANFEETFPVKVTLTAEDGKKINSTISVAGNEGAVAQEGKGTNEVVITFDVTDGSNVTISNIPYGVSYEVEETETKNYTTTYDDNKTGKIKAASISTDIVNTKTIEIATGISLENLPYIILLVGVAIGIGALILKRRKNFEY